MDALVSATAMGRWMLAYPRAAGASNLKPSQPMASPPLGWGHPWHKAPPRVPA